MLTRRRLASILLAIACALPVSFAVAASTVSSASGAEGGITCGPGFKRVWVGTRYMCVSDGTTPQPTTPPANGGGDTPVATPPTCDLNGLDNSGYDNPSPPYCAENSVCRTVDNFAPLLPPAGERPQEDSKERVEVCRHPPGPVTPGTPFWSDDEEPPTLLEQALTAIGEINLPTPTINMSPATRTLVNLDTWFWLGDTPPQTTGSSAFGLVAIAELRTTTIDPGDGTGSFTCPSATDAATAERDCHHEYTRSSVRGTATVAGRPAYAVTAGTVYTLRFEVDGEPVQVDGAPATLNGPTTEAAVRVDEVQTVVKRG